MRRDVVVTALCLLVLMVSIPAIAEVRAITGRDGGYKMTRVMLAGDNDRIWGPLRDVQPNRALNLMGDRNGDLWPTIAESNLAPHHPWVVWSRRNDVQYDLAWSRWTPAGWEPINWVAPPPQTVEYGDDLDVDIAFDPNGRPYVVWWRHQDDFGEVYVSVFLETTWMSPVRLSEHLVDSRYPTIELQEGNNLVVWYETDQGVMEQTVMFNGTVAITDDINPMDYIYMVGKPVIVSEY